MTDTDTATEGGSSQSQMLTVALKNGAVVEVDISLLPADVYAGILAAGLKAKIEGSGMSKLGPKYYEGGKDDPKLKADTQAKAEENVEKLYKGEIGAGKKAAVKLSGEVKTEAMRLARAKVKELLKAAGKKISHYKASEISEAAKALIEADGSYVQLAEAAIKSRKEAPVKTDIMSLIKADPALVAKDEAEKAEKASQLSAKQAGMPKPRKGKGAAQAQA